MKNLEEKEKKLRFALSKLKTMKLSFDEMNKIRLQNIEKLSKTISSINNIIFFG